MLHGDDLGSDSSDEDYQPGGESEVSEEEGEGVPEELVAAADVKPTKTGKRRKQDATNPKKKRMLVLEGEDVVSVPKKDEESERLKQEIEEDNQRKKQENEKKKADSLFADFMKDVSRPRPRPKPASGGLGSLMSSSTSKPQAKTSTPASVTSAGAGQSSKVTITKVFDFAGETVSVTKDVDANSREAKQASTTKTDSSKPAPKMTAPFRRGGMASIVGNLGKAPKMSVLEKSKLDWQSFKKEESLEEELEQHKRSKDSYLEKQDFLQRADLRQFEMEKSIRDRHRTPR